MLVKTTKRHGCTGLAKYTLGAGKLQAIVGAQAKGLGEFAGGCDDGIIDGESVVALSLIHI